MITTVKSNSISTPTLVSKETVSKTTKLFLSEVTEYLRKTDRESLILTNHTCIYGGTGSGKTSNSLSKFLMNLDKETLLLIPKNKDRELNYQHIRMITEQTNGLAKVVTDVIPTSSDNVLLVSYYNMKEFVSKIPHKRIYLFVDEFCQFFNPDEMNLYEIVNYIANNLINESTSKEEIKRILREFQEKENISGNLFAKVSKCFLNEHLTKLEAFVYLFMYLTKSKPDFKSIFISATGENTKGNQILKDLFEKNTDQTLSLLKAVKKQIVEYKYVVEIPTDVCGHIAGYDENKPRIYEALISVVRDNLVRDIRSMIVIRFSQLGVLKEMFNELIRIYGKPFLYTDSLDEFNTNSQYKLLIAYDDDLRKYQGINIPNLRALYFLSLGKYTNIPDLIQTLGRVGRADQPISFVFLITEVGTNKASLRQANTRNIIKNEILEGAEVVRLSNNCDPMNLRFLPIPHELKKDKTELTGSISRISKTWPFYNNNTGNHTSIIIKTPSFVEKGVSFLDKIGKTTETVLPAVLPPVMAILPSIPPMRICDGHINGLCRKGTTCLFSHKYTNEERDQRILEVRKKNGICPFYLLNICKNKDHLCLREHMMISNKKEKHKYFEEVNKERASRGLSTFRIFDKK